MKRTRTLIKIHQIADTEEFYNVQEQARKDGDDISDATHCVVKDGDYVGAFCVASPTVYWWMDSEKTNILDSMHVMTTLETLAKEKGIQVLTFPVSKNSPYNKIMETWGYIKSDEEWYLYYKDIT